MTQENPNPSPEQENPAAPSGAESASAPEAQAAKTHEQEIAELKNLVAQLMDKLK